MSRVKCKLTTPAITVTKHEELAPGRWSKPSSLPARYRKRYHRPALEDSVIETMIDLGEPIQKVPSSHGFIPTAARDRRRGRSSRNYRAFLRLAISPPLVKAGDSVAVVAVSYPG